ncbi:hypothetical protein H5410_030657, partial [Solanum commersonii]
MPNSFRAIVHGEENRRYRRNLQFSSSVLQLLLFSFFTSALPEKSVFEEREKHVLQSSVLYLHLVSSLRKECSGEENRRYGEIFSFHSSINYGEKRVLGIKS